MLRGRFGSADLIRHKHFGAAAASSGGVEMYHIAGVTPEAPSVEAAFGGRKPLEVISYGVAERRRTYDNLNSKASDTQVDFVMLGCPHYSLEQIRAACAMLEGKRVSTNCKLWIFTSRAVKAMSDSQGLSKQIARCRSGAADRHLLIHQPGDSTRYQGGCARFGEADALPARLHEYSGVVRIDPGLHQRGGHQPLEWSGAMSVDTVVLQGRKVVGGVAEGEALVTRQTISGWGGVN